MARTRGQPEIVVGLLDGPVAAEHPDLYEARLHKTGEWAQHFGGSEDRAYRHGTFVAGVLAARRDSQAPGLCPDCTYLIRPIFEATTNRKNPDGPSTSPVRLAEGIKDCVDRGARLLNLSAAFVQPSINPAPMLEQALDYAARRGVAIIAAAGNQATIGTSVITRHPSVIPVAAADVSGRVISSSNVGGSIGRRGLAAPGVNITSLDYADGVQTWTGTSAATPFVTGAFALLLSLFSTLPIEEVKAAVLQAAGRQRHSVLPPYLNGEAAYHLLRARKG
ncbi:S8 family serine peptidase [Geodermatophilus marinus]|uniref:S8 family serine peptidase n=1 Tax=Geodermatophilus sp. LHW52908 TaxID=2303986 RepID=UPI000E3EE152|nr:S8 family serine peptidase [Geodermatophilus sp. LHW52908]RFU18795.1 peptidase S8 [Geodermatophilus sp. LHW52908]